MPNLFSLANIYTVSQGLSTIAIITVPFVVLAIYARYKSASNRKVNAYLALSLAVFTVAFNITNVLLNEIFGDDFRSYVTVALLIALVVVIQNLSLFVSSYISRYNSSSFDPDHVVREHFDNTLTSIATVVILAIGITPFTEIQVVGAIMLAFITIGISLFTNHFIARTLFSERK